MRNPPRNVTELVDQLLELARSCGDALEVARRDRPVGLTLKPVDPAGFGIRVDVVGETLVVKFAPWSHRWSLEVLDPEQLADVCRDAFDLVVAGLVGRALVRVHRRGGREFRWDVCFGSGSRWHLHGCVRRLAWPWPLRSRNVELRNNFSPPGELELNEPRYRSFRPWESTVRYATDDVDGAGPIAIDGELDLHPFQPKEVGALVQEYIETCLAAGRLDLRLVHGKGKGQLRRTVHAVLRRHPAVRSFRLGGHGEGSWGATIVALRSATEVDSDGD